MSNDLVGLLISLCQFPFPIFTHSTPDKEVLKTEIRRKKVQKREMRRLHKKANHKITDIDKKREITNQFNKYFSLSFYLT